MKYVNIRLFDPCGEILPIQDDDIIDIANGAIWRQVADET